MSLNSRQRTTYFVFSGIFLVFFLSFFIFDTWLRWFHVPELAQRINIEELAVQSVKTQQTGVLKPELRDLFQRYSDGISAVDSLYLARDQVFSGEWDEEDFQPVMLLDYPDFLEKLRLLLGNKTFFNSLTVSSTGQVSFLIQTTSYLNAARQIDALRRGLSEENQRDVVDTEDTEDFEDAEEKPLLLTGFSVTSVGRNEISGEADDQPNILKRSDASYDFVVQAQINPAYYLYQYDLQLEAQDAAVEAAQ
ncbi:MAG: hypothetical protein P1V18_03720 [Candidatus Gracilibacteria bacterium]|nr:hypothetical protein [Candidatus Gracilibacteria bacterium]